MSEPSRQRSFLIVALLSVAACCPFLLYPTQIPFGVDEAQLVERAFDSNRNHTLAILGLYGSTGRPYGPPPVWIYQGLLLVSHDPTALATLKIALFMGVLAGSLLWIARSARLWPWPLLAGLLSPYVMLAARQLWDNSWNIPIGALAVAFYAAYLAASEKEPDPGRCPWAGRPYLLGAVVTTGVCILVHLMALPLALALLVHLRWRLPKHFRADQKTLLLGLAIAALLGIRYWPQFIAPGGPLSTGNTSLKALCFSLLGPRVLSAAYMDHFFYQWPERAGTTAAYLHPDSAWAPAFRMAEIASLLAYPIVWVGLLLGARAARGRQAAADPATELLLLGTLIVLIQIPFNYATDTYGPPHYYNGTVIAYVLLFWAALHHFSGSRPARALLGIQLTALLLASGLLMARVIQTRGTQGIAFGPTLATQIELARDPAHGSPGSSEGPSARTSVEAMRALGKLLNLPPGGPTTHAGQERRGPASEPRLR